MTALASMDGATTNTVLDEADSLLEEEGMVSSPLALAVEEHIDIQNERREPSDTASFAAKAELGVKSSFTLTMLMT